MVRCVGRHGESVIAGELEADVMALGYRPMEARLHDLIARLLDEKGDARGAVDRAHRAAQAALAGRDMLVRAKTGTGKTAAFCVPIVERVPPGSRRPHAVVLAPTRELAQQIGEECRAIAKYKDVNIAVLVGGLAMGPQEKQLKNGVEIVVGTPGRVLDHLRRKARFTLKATDEGAALPHAKAMRVQVGGLRGLHAVLSPDEPVPERIEDINGIVEEALARFGDLASLPYQPIIQQVAAYKGRRRFRKSR